MKYIPTEDDLNYIKSFRKNRTESKLDSQCVLMTMPYDVYREYAKMWGPGWTNIEKHQIEFLRTNPQYKVTNPTGKNILGFKASKGDGITRQGGLHV